MRGVRASDRAADRRRDPAHLAHQVLELPRRERLLAVGERPVRAGIAAGADGIIVEVHPRPDRALSDGQQSLTPREFEDLMRQVRGIAAAIGRAV